MSENAIGLVGSGWAVSDKGSTEGGFVRGEIIETTTRMAVLVDQRNWEGLVDDVFADEVRVDYTSLNGE